MRPPSHPPFPILLLAWLFFFLSLFPLSTPSIARAEIVSELINQRRVEMLLIHLPIDRTLLGALPVFDDKTHKLRLRVSSEAFDDAKPILLLHLWASWCQSCKKEFPLWNQIRARLDKQVGSWEVKIVHISLDRDVKELAGFLKLMGDRMPAAPKFMDHNGLLSDLLQKRLRQEAPLPITLLLGPGRTVHQAIFGPLSDRMSEVVESTERLMEWVKYMREMSRLPPHKDEVEDVFTRSAPCSCPCVCN